MSLMFGCIPNEFKVKVATPYAVLSRVSMQLVASNKKRLLATYDLPVVDPSDGEMRVYDLRVADTVRRQYTDAVQTNTTGPAGSTGGLPATGTPLGKITFEFLKAPSIDLGSAEIKYPEKSLDPNCRNMNLEGASLLAVIEPQARMQYFTLIQEKLSDLILKINETMANILVAALVLMFFWLLSFVVSGLTRIYLISDDALRSKLSGRLPATTPDRVEKNKLLTRSRYSSIRRRLVVARVVGPALGFLLTVSSLIAGLHPSVTAEQDTFRFVSALQLALVATFMGLLVRIVAEFALRYEHDAAERELQLLG